MRVSAAAFARSLDVITASLPLEDEAFVARNESTSSVETSPLRPAVGERLEVAASPRARALAAARVAESRDGTERLFVDREVERLASPRVEQAPR